MRLATVVLTAGDGEVARWPIERAAAPQMDVIDSLARAQLTAKRFGWTVSLRDAVPALVELIEFAGLDLVVEVRR